jgi:hypothetical protein
MDEMLTLLPTGARSDDTIFLALFLLCLPTSMQDHLAATDHKSAAGMPAPASLPSPPSSLLFTPLPHATLLATTASVLQTDASTAVTTASSAGRHRARTVAVTNLSATTTAGSGKRPTSVRHPVPGRKTRLPTGPDSRRDQSLCHYHSRFGKKAHKCEAPCSWAEN